jgi:hypothetical protein
MVENILLSSDTKEKKDSYQLPTLLAGPILRRAEQNQVCIWIACSKAVDIRAEIFLLSDLEKMNTDGNSFYIGGRNDDQTKGIKPIGLGSTQSIRLGEQLHIGLVIVRPIQLDIEGNRSSSNIENNVKVSFPTDDLLAYDIEVTYYIDSSRQKKRERLKDFGLLSGKNTIVYKSSLKDNNNKEEGIRLPTFFIRGQENTLPLNLVYGSCRKLHGKGEDCLVITDEIISNSVKDLNKRPSALFLTGDQIYADDVADVLIKYLTQFSIRLLGWEEQVNGVGKKLIDILIGERQQLVQELAKFTSENAGNHLLSFGEFAAMYLVAWNVENWPEKYTTELLKKTSSQKEQKIIHIQIENLERARNVLPAIRRVLANIPTYMICDDHDITDDWNITKEWVEAVKDSRCGKQIVANGLAAYWAFQAWGNNPDLYKEDFIQVITGYLGKNGNITNEEKGAFENHIWNYHGWTFDVPTHPLTIFLDCRTQRQYDSFQGPPQLINDDELQSILRTIERTNYEKSQPIILVSPTPVFGFDLAESLQEYLAGKSSVYKWDLETWSANEKGFVRFLSFLIHNLRPGHCIFLSGDVHYAFTISATFTLLSQMEKYRKKGGENGDDHYLSMNITQLNSSALKTTSLGKQILLNEVMGHFRQLFTSRHSIRIGWNDALFKSKKLKDKDSNPYAIINRLKYNSNIIGEKEVQQPYSLSPDWIESRSILKASDSGISSLIIADNNLGLVSVYGDRYKLLKHKLLVRKERDITTKIYETILELGS